MQNKVLVTAIGTITSTNIVLQLKNNPQLYIIGGDIYKKNQIVTSKDVNEFYTFPSAVDDLNYYIEFALEFCREHGINFYFASIDEEIVNLSKHRRQFEEIGVKLCIPNHELIMLCHYKNVFSNWVSENIPEIHIRQYMNLSDIDKFPVYIKPTEGRASIGCKKVDGLTEAAHFFRNKSGSSEYLIQEYIEGEIVTVDLIRNKKTKETRQIQRIESVRNSNGCGIAIEIIHNAQLEKICNELMEKLDLNGVVNAEFFFSEINGSFKIIEINPRFSAGACFSCLAGCDIVNGALKIANNEMCGLSMPVIGVHMAKRYEAYITE